MGRSEKKPVQSGDVAIRKPATREGAPKSAHKTRLLLVIDRTLYAVSPVAPDPVVATRAFRLNKADGTLYDVAQTAHGIECDCPDFVFRRDGIDPNGCKHVRALLDQGLIGVVDEVGGRR